MRRRLLIGLPVLALAGGLTVAPTMVAGQATKSQIPNPLSPSVKCHSTVGEYEQFVRTHYRKGKLHGPNARAGLLKISGCLGSRQARRDAHSFRLKLIAKQTIPTPNAGPVGASTFDDYGPDGGGPPACGFHAALGLAHKTLPCGTRVLICAQRCAIGTVQDRGPFSGSRVFDLTPRLASRVGFAGVPNGVRYRILGR